MCSRCINDGSDGQRWYAAEGECIKCQQLSESEEIIIAVFVSGVLLAFILLQRYGVLLFLTEVLLILPSLLNETEALFYSPGFLYYPLKLSRNF